jgi:hypothetical protein
MIIVAHIVASGVAGEMTASPLPAFFIGLILHFILDAIPHFDNIDNHRWTRRQITFTTLDVLISLFLIFYVFAVRIDSSLFTNTFVWGSFGGLLPDILDNVPFWSKKFRATKFGKVFHKFHDWLHFIKTGVFWGSMTQIITILFFIAIHYFFKK